MALPQPFGDDFDTPVPSPDRPEVSVRFKPTQTVYVFTVVTDRAERTRSGSALAPGSRVIRQGTDLGGYDEAEVEQEARRRALAPAEKVVGGK